LRRLDVVPERLAPEPRGGIQILGLAIDDESGESALVHGDLLGPLAVAGVGTGF
jgi:hypothetical protein